MLKAPIPEDEPYRILDLHRLGLLDTPPEERFDRLTRVAQAALGTPIVLVSLVDSSRQWFKSMVGLDVRETSREISFCGHAVAQADVFVVADTLEDPRFSDNPLVTGEPRIRFYAGYPLTLKNGGRVGTLCAIDAIPRLVGPEFLATLRDIGTLVEREISVTQLAALDDETGLLPDGVFEFLSHQAVSQCNQTHRRMTVAVLELETANGAEQAPERLKKVAEAMRKECRAIDIIGRHSPSQIVVTMPNCDQPSAEAMLVRVKQRLANTIDSCLAAPLSVRTATVEMTPPEKLKPRDLVAAASAKLPH